MSRRGAALAAALLVVLLGGLLVATSVTWAITELRAGAAWSGRARAEAGLATAASVALPLLHLLLDSVPPGSRVEVRADSGGEGSSLVEAVPLGDSLVLLESRARFREGEVRAGLVVRLRPDSLGGAPVGTAPKHRPLP